MSYDVVCLSHLRWDFVYQRPQHLLSRCAREHRVFFIEEPVHDEGPARFEVAQPEPGVWTVRPHLPSDLSAEQAEVVQRTLLRGLFAEWDIERYVLWYYTPMALGFTRDLSPLATVYDCMDELTLFAGAPPLLREREAQLFRRADMVFTGGQSLYEAKRRQHQHVFAFPSSVDAAHFRRARAPQTEAGDQHEMPRPRLGFYGVIDERLDLDLLEGVATLRPEWQIAMVGPVVKIDPETLPRRPNIHYLGSKSYKDLPKYLAGWDVAIMPFAHNDATRFISPTKTLEYLAAGRPVVSTSIKDVVVPYGRQGLVHIADCPTDFVASAERALDGSRSEWLRNVDAFLAGTSWDRTWLQMQQAIDLVVETREPKVLPFVSPAAAGIAKPNWGAKGSRVLPFPSREQQPMALRTAQKGAE